MLYQIHQIDKLLTISWWDWDHQRIQDACKDLSRGIESFLEKYKYENHKGFEKPLSDSIITPDEAQSLVRR